MSSPSRRGDIQIKQADAEVADILAADAAAPSKRAWKRKVLDGKTVEEILEVRPDVRQIGMRVNTHMATVLSSRAREEGMTRLAWMRRALANEIIRTGGGDFDALTGGFAEPPIAMRPKPLP